MKYVLLPVNASGWQLLLYVLFETPNENSHERSQSPRIPTLNNTESRVQYINLAKRYAA